MSDGKLSIFCSADWKVFRSNEVIKKSSYKEAFDFKSEIYKKRQDQTFAI